MLYCYTEINRVSGYKLEYGLVDKQYSRAFSTETSGLIERRTFAIFSSESLCACALVTLSHVIASTTVLAGTGLTLTSD